MVSWTPAERIEIRGKYVVTVSSSGIERELRNELRLQARVVF
jgi:ribosome maturation factor RimP